MTDTAQLHFPDTPTWTGPIARLYTRTYPDGIVWTTHDVDPTHLHGCVTDRRILINGHHFVGGLLTTLTFDEDTNTIHGTGPLFLDAITKADPALARLLRTGQPVPASATFGPTLDHLGKRQPVNGLMIGHPDRYHPTWDDLTTFIVITKPRPTLTDKIRRIFT